VNYFNRLIMQSGLHIANSSSYEDTTKFAGSNAAGVGESRDNDIVELNEVVELSPPSVDDLTIVSTIPKYMNGEKVWTESLVKNEVDSAQPEKYMEFDIQASKGGKGAHKTTIQAKPETPRISKTPEVSQSEVEPDGEAAALQTLHQVIEWVAADPVYKDKKTAEQVSSQSQVLATDDELEIHANTEAEANRDQRASVNIENSNYRLEEPQPKKSTRSSPSQRAVPREFNENLSETLVSAMPAAEQLEEIVQLSIGSINVHVETAATPSPMSATAQIPAQQVVHLTQSSTQPYNDSRLRRRYLRL